MSRCEQCTKPRLTEPVETVDGKGTGWKCVTCGWWNWISCDVTQSFAVPLSCGLPNDMPLDSWPCSTEDSADWYAVIAITHEPCEDKDGAFEVETAVIVDVRRMDWPLPDGTIDLRVASRPSGEDTTPPIVSR